MYTIEQLSIITGLTTRTLRNYIKAGILCGNKEDRVWKFSEEQIQAFISHPSVRPSIQAKHHAIIYDFLAGYENTANEMCILLDLTLDANKAQEIATFFCNAANHSKHIRFAFSYEKPTAHYILKGEEAEIHEIMREYYLR